MRRIAIANQKGGVGKTTTAVNVAEGLAEQGHRVLLIDLDPQGNATQTLLGRKVPADEVTVYDFLLPGKQAVPFEDVVLPTRTPGVDVLPSSDALEVANKQFAAQIGGQMALQRRLKAIDQSYHYVLIDTQPSLSLLTINGLAAAQELIVPITPGVYETGGLLAFRDTIAPPLLADEARKGRGNEITPGSNHIKFSTINGAPRTNPKKLQHPDSKQRGYNSSSRGNSPGFDMQQRLILRKFERVSEFS